MNSPGTVQVEVRHILSDELSGGVIRPKKRTIKWVANQCRLPRPPAGKHSVELDCPRCSASLLAEVRGIAWTRRVRILLRVLAALCLVVFVCAVPYAIHVGGQTLPEGQSLPTLFPVSVFAIFGTFVAGPTFLAMSRHYDGVSLLDAPKPRRQHQIRAVRERGPLPSTASPTRRR
ncbi:hypothetical protein ABZT03_05455 [Streptomyces sp. NPDC005574]|uniref:hypothetical protein n=1 Tax=Streptomyces sp. NPDC005574 TaxID=3156891 RepID=UPI0033AAA1B1